MYFGHLKQRGIKQDERDHACIYDLNFAMEREQHKFPSLDLMLNLVPNPIKSLFLGEINSQWAPQVSKYISLVN